VLFTSVKKGSVKIICTSSSSAADIKNSLLFHYEYPVMPARFHVFYKHILFY